MVLLPDLSLYVQGLLEEAALIPEPRQERLRALAAYVRGRLQAGQRARLNFICTHNSRRSHMGQVWAATAAAYHALDEVDTFSGGTEATAFNPRAVAAMERAGFRITHPDGENPHYLVRYARGYPPLVCFSKTYDHPTNPLSDYAAVMTCSDADANCPFIPGATRLALTYEDPKVADGTPQEAARYDERVRQIGRELLFAMGQV